MKTLLRMLAVAALLALAPAVFAADDPIVGTWKFNAAMSTSNVPMPKTDMRTYTASGDAVTLVWSRTTADGKDQTVKSTFQYDGKDYPVTGSTDFDALVLKRIDANTVESTQKRAGKEVGTTKRTLSADGKTLTLVTKMTTAKGTEVTSTSVYDRQ